MEEKMPKGIDYAWSHPAISVLTNSGFKFACRYLSGDSSKNISAGERSALNGAGIAVVVVWETTTSRMLGGYTAGQADARSANTQATSAGMPGIPVYFAADWDCAEHEQGPINAYLDGAANIIGRNRTGIYGGYWPVKRALDAGKAKYAWQTYSWSGGNWDRRAQIRQVQNGVPVGGVMCDLDYSYATDYGQWPRPGGPAPVTYLTDAQMGAMMGRLPVLQAGMNDNDLAYDYVGRLQSILDGVYGYTVVVDGSFGSDTTRAVKQLQARYGLVQDGIVGPLTWSPVITGEG
jgi:hypothetical protein